MIFVIKVTTNKEERVLEMIEDKVRKKDLEVYAVIRPHGLRGYILLEASEREVAEEAAFNLPYVKGILGKQVSFEEIESMLQPKMEEINIEKGDIVEMLAEPFKKENAKVIRVDKQKGEAIVTLLNAAIPIPVTVKIDNLKVIRREDGEDDEEESENKEESQREGDREIVPGFE